MKALIQSYQGRGLRLADVPAPALQPGGVLVRTAASLVSPGTERQMVRLAEKSLVGKALERPDLVRQVIDKLRRDGVASTVRAVRGRLDEPVAMGYSSAGTVLAVGDGVESVRPGDRVACAGAGYASHAEIVSVPKNLVVGLPDEVDFESAAFTTLGAIALQGIRLADARLGEVVAVIGLGLLGQLAVQILRAAGCVVVGMDIRPDRAALAQQMGASAVSADRGGLAAAVSRLSGGRGADAVLITAATHSSEPVEIAGEIARDQGKVVVVGAVGMELPRKPYYDKEIVFRVSRSYGPGRYDPDYEEKGHDYPFGHVRWTENRNMQAFAQLMAVGSVNVRPLITHRFEIGAAAAAYDLITGEQGGSSLGVVLTYPGEPGLSSRLDLRPAIPSVPGESAMRIGLLGAGSFATSTLLPAMKKVQGLEMAGVCTATGISAEHAARKFGFRYATTSEQEILTDPDVNLVVIATRHHLHAGQVISALEAGKYVFCEKPLCLSEQELARIIETANRLEARPWLMVGYNRRFAPLGQQMKAFLDRAGEPLVMYYQVNAGYIPPDHWVHDPEQGGGRIIGEVCHFVDFLTFLAGSPLVSVHAQALPNSGRYRDDNVVIHLGFGSGSIGTISYVANGDRLYPKERIEVFGGGSVAMLDNFRRLEMFRGGRRRVVRSWGGQDKGHAGEWQALARAFMHRQAAPIPFEDIVSTSAATFEIVQSIARSVS